MAKFRRDLHRLAGGEEAVLAVLCGQRLQRVRFVPLRKPAGAVVIGEEGIIQPHAHIPERQGEDAVRSVRIIGVLVQIARDPMLLVAVIELHEANILQIIGLVLLHLDFLCHRIELISLRERQAVFPGIELEVISAEGIGRQALRVSLFVLHDDARGRHRAAVREHLAAHVPLGKGDGRGFGRVDPAIGKIAQNACTEDRNRPCDRKQRDLLAHYLITSLYRFCIGRNFFCFPPLTFYINHDTMVQSTIQG